MISNDLSVIDKDSFSFRYPVTKRWEPSTDNHLTINFYQFSTRMSEILERMETINFGLNLEIDKINRANEKLNPSDKI
jgi:hypothetical protein